MNVTYSIIALSEKCSELPAFTSLMNRQFTDEQLVSFARQFRELDILNTNSLDRTTLGQILRSEGQPLDQLMIVLLFEKYDKDGNGTIDFNEFLTFCCSMQSKTDREILTEIFHVADVDGNGTLCLEEVERLGKMMGLDVSKSDAQATVKALDQNNDDLIDLEEFLAILGK